VLVLVNFCHLTLFLLPAITLLTLHVIGIRYILEVVKLPALLIDSLQACNIPMVHFWQSLQLLVGVSCCPLAYSSSNGLDGVKILITAPPNYSPRLQGPLELAGASVVSCPTIVTEFMTEPEDVERLRSLLEDLSDYDYVAFTSRQAIQAAIQIGGPRLIECLQSQKPKALALGVDAEELVSAGVDRSAILVPDDATPDGIVSVLDFLLLVDRINSGEKTSRKRRILCPVPRVEGGLSEPPVIPNFLKNLQNLGLEVDRVDAYVTKWARPSHHAKQALQGLLDGSIQVMCFSSTAEAEGLLLLCQEYGLDWKTCKAKIIAHGPVAAEGARALGFKVHAISKDSSSFSGMVGAVSESLVESETEAKD
jgi:uroporphyrinogen-III synthase